MSKDIVVNKQMSTQSVAFINLLKNQAHMSIIYQQSCVFPTTLVIYLLVGSSIG